MTLKDLFKAAHQAGNDGIDFESWFERWSNDPEFVEVINEASKDYTPMETNVLWAPAGKNIIAPGSNIVCGGNFHLGDK